MGKILAIDYGRARIGLALSNSLQTIAFPSGLLKTEKDIPSTALALVQKIHSFTDPIETIVIGYPLLLNGKKGEMALEVDFFVEELKKNISLPIILWDERLTSSGIEKEFRSLNINRKKRSKILDSASATLILQNYLDARSCHQNK